MTLKNCCFFFIKSNVLGNWLDTRAGSEKISLQAVTGYSFVLLGGSPPRREARKIGLPQTPRAERGLICIVDGLEIPPPCRSTLPPLPSAGVYIRAANVRPYILLSSTSLRIISYFYYDYLYMF